MLMAKRKEMFSEGKNLGFGKGRKDESHKNMVSPIWSNPFPSITKDSAILALKLKSIENIS